MVNHEKLLPAMRAIQYVCIRTRKLAYDETEHATIADVMDRAEYLVGLLCMPDECTDEFRKNLVELVENREEFGPVLEYFDERLA
jgi:hypothetical protein